MNNIWAALKAGTASGAVFGGFAYAPNFWYVGANAPKYGRRTDTIQQAVNLMQDGDVVMVGNAAEYDESVTITGKNKCTILGQGWGSRVTALTGGFAFHLVGCQDVALVNLNLEGRTTGGAVKLSGQCRRIFIENCKLHGGTYGVLIASGGGGQLVDCVIRGNRIGPTTNGVVAAVAGGDPSHQIQIEDNWFTVIMTDCINLDDTRNIVIRGNHFGSFGDGEPDHYIVANVGNTSGLVSNNYFANATHPVGLIILDADVLYSGNYAESGVNTARPA